MKTALEIPVVNLETEEGTLVNSVEVACREWGFFQVVGHGIDGALRHRFFDSTRHFFSLPKEVKDSVARTRRNPWGYYDRELTKNRKDWKEIFDFGYDLEDDSYAQWPVGEDAFRSTMLEWFSTCESLSLRLLRLIAQSMKVDPSQLETSFEGKHTSFLRLNYYPVCPDPAAEDVDGEDYTGHLGISRHTDAGALTVLAQDEVASLQVGRGGNWITVKPLDQAFIVNVGDLFQVWSNDDYKAP